MKETVMIGYSQDIQRPKLQADMTADTWAFSEGLLGANERYRVKV